jgi:hypothetical protein
MQRLKRRVKDDGDDDEERREFVISWKDSYHFKGDCS